MESEPTQGQETHLDRIEKLLVSIDEKLDNIIQADLEKAVLDVIHKLEVSRSRLSYGIL